MRVGNIYDMKKGWFVGNFDPSLYVTDSCEVAVKRYAKGDKEGKHYHRIATELTVVVTGCVKMFDRVFGEGDVIVVEPGEATAFEALEDTTNVVVKLPSANNDKYIVEDEKND